MVFTEEIFLYYFLPLIMLLYYLLPKDGETRQDFSSSSAWLYYARKIAVYPFYALIVGGVWAFYFYLMEWLGDWKFPILAKNQLLFSIILIVLTFPLLYIYYQTIKNNPNRSPFWIRNLWLTIMGYIFYSWFEPWFVIPMLFTNVADYFWGNYIGQEGHSDRHRKWALAASVATNLGMLGVFKYGVFTQVNLNHLLSLLGQQTFQVVVIAFPIGISFYTFHSMSYIIDIYRGEKPVKNFADFSCFVSLFPQLVAGPILRYNVLALQLHTRSHTLSMFTKGTILFMLGFAMKILLANPVGQIADAAFGAANPHWYDAWWGVIAYACQIYFDFNGYSVMALGLGNMFGFELIRNFNDPYRSQSITEFWRRWHISLSSWLREYLYFPLGGNKKGEARTYINLALVMLLGGFWHGSQWQFIIWGAIHGGMLALERWMGKQPFYGSWPKAARVGITMFAVLIAWVFFRATDLPHAISYIASMFGSTHTDSFSILLASELYRLNNVFAMALCLFMVWEPLQSYEYALKITWVRYFVAFGLFLLAIVMMYTQSFNPFLYFQF